MRKIKVFSRSVSGDSSMVETMIVESIDKWQKEHPTCCIIGHNMTFQNLGSPRLFISLEYDEPETPAVA